MLDERIKNSYMKTFASSLPWSQNSWSYEQFLPQKLAGFGNSLLIYKGAKLLGGQLSPPVAWQPVNLP